MVFEKNSTPAGFTTTVLCCRTVSQCVCWLCQAVSRRNLLQQEAYTQIGFQGMKLERSEDPEAREQSRVPLKVQHTSSHSCCAAAVV
eukprot:4980429-Amphidinium_carterae.1